MKTLRLIGTALLMTVLCLNFTACSSDDDDNSTSGSGSGLIKSISWNLLPDESLVETYKYDASGRLVEYLYAFTDVVNELHKYTYEKEKIFDNVSEDDLNIPSDSKKYSVIYTLENGKIVAEESEANGNYNIIYTYDQKNQLISKTRNGGIHSSETYTWKDGNMVSKESINHSSVSNYEYSSLKNSTLFDANRQFVDYEPLSNYLVLSRLI